MNFYRKLFQSESVKGLLKDLKVTMKSAEQKTMKKNPTLSSLDWKVAMIRKQALKAEVAQMAVTKKQLKQ